MGSYPNSFHQATKDGARIYGITHCAPALYYPLIGRQPQPRIINGLIAPSVPSENRSISCNATRLLCERHKLILDGDHDTEPSSSAMIEIGLQCSLARVKFAHCGGHLSREAGKAAKCECEGKRERGGVKSVCPFLPLARSDMLP